MSASPSEIRSPRMEALARLPVFFALAGKRTVVAGGSAAAGPTKRHPSRRPWANAATR